MNKSNQIIAFFRQTYRLRFIQEGYGVGIILEERIDPHWKGCLVWDDLDHLANLLVKQGFTADHAEALNLLNNIHAVGNG